MTSPIPSPLLPSVFTDETEDAPSATLSAAKPWQKRRSRPSFTAQKPSNSPSLGPWAIAETGETVRPAANNPTVPETEAAKQGHEQNNVPDVELTAEENEQDVPYLEPDDEEGIIAPPNFRPFFTVIEDAETSEVYHPSTYYVFSDDDPAIITAACIRALHTSPSNNQDLNEHELELLPLPKPGVEERYIVVDVSADGQSVEKAESLSCEWAIMKSMVGPAPSFGGGQDEDEEQALMLKIEGSASAPAGKAKSGAPKKIMEEARKVQGGDLGRAMEEIVKGIRKSVAELEGVVGDAALQDK